jgi:long-chain acyl-CoA synthetase
VQVAAITLVEEPFSVENNLLTPTFKLKRPQAKAAFQEAIDRMYAKVAAK